ncbi:uncharacterized protein LOC121188309 isoform X4 [Toxotes jaculatrix]|uniref:uncharacterized protein LOC121188309 isoform X2 n=1 Tax=Toxotes jaculatrix TaxID=941984 RepID=UPI001B3AF74C|nr:uncharacterized protein LOC121188309 isoform X2 [Toxotes jaculatrix]XP_040903923.1 uncharacterized protein LOC121188309 isoform X3 [Toxotes jaculatrix]XP_040903924.1 uncharacterized protein LOC121188309 isoform X4 [Toxotes jaculatrix]
MSHKHPYRQPPSDSDLRPDPGPYRSSDLDHPSPDHDFYRPPQESFSSPYASSSSSRGSAPWPQDRALSILSSLGLEPGDLSLLAELPEDVLTVESLPHVLKQIKGKRGTVRPSPPNAACPSSFSSSSSPSYPPSSACRPAVSSCGGGWDQLLSQSVQYPLHQIPPSPLPSEQVQDHWGNPRTSSNVVADPPSSSSSSIYVVDFHHRPGPSDYGKTGRASGPVSSQDRPSFRSGEQKKRTHPSRFSEPGSAGYRSVPPPDAQGGRPKSETSSIRRSLHTATASMPSKREAQDFHGMCPQVFPYSCSLCDITVLSEKVWIKHINNTQHANGQLSLLQQFPNWDCRMETLSRADNQSEKRKDEANPAQPPQSANQSQKPEQNKQKKTSEKGKVVCVKFPAQSVDETYLRKLTEPFGKIVKILMFPSLAFVELGSVDQAKDLVKFHVNYPPTVNGEQMEFSISSTFSFLQSSQVVSFTPAPTGEDGQSDLISIIKRFGPPLYTLFLPSAASVEMKNAADAQKLVDYYSSNTLRINNDVLKVSFSGQYKTLMRVASAKKYEEEMTPAKRTRSQSREDEDKTAETKRRKSSCKDKVEQIEEEGGKSSRERRTRSTSRDKSIRERRTRSTSRDKSIRERRTRSTSRDKSIRERRTRSTSRDKSIRERRTRSTSRDKSIRERRTRSTSRDKSKTKSSRERTNFRSRSRDKSRTRSKSRSRDKYREKSRSTDKSSRRSSSQNRSREKTVEPEKAENPDSESRTDPEPAPVRDSRPETTETEQSEEEAESSAEESDIEGMEVIGEDGESLEDEDKESLDDAEEEEEASEGNHGPAERPDSPGQGEEKEVKDGETEDQDTPVIEEREEDSETAETQQDHDEEEPSFPVDLENCITLDELDEDESDDQEIGAEPESTRVLYFRNLPLRFYTDTEFVRLVKGSGKAVRYLLIRQQREGFIEMSSSSEAVRAVRDLTCTPVTFHGCKLSVQFSDKYKRLTNWWDVQSDEDEDEEKRSERRSWSSRRRSERRSSSRRSERRSKSKTSDRDEKESSQKSPDKESGSNKSTKKESTNKRSSGNKSASRKTLEEEEDKKTQDKDVKNTSEKESAARETPEKETANEKTTEVSVSIKTEETDSAAEKTTGKDLTPETNPETETPQRRGTHEKDPAPEKPLKTKSESDEAPAEEELMVNDASGKGTVEICEEERSAGLTVSELHRVWSPDVCSSDRGRPSLRPSALCLWERSEMKDPSLSNVSAPNMTISNEVILSSQFGSEDDPFAEYMWMENEEEFNRQVEEELWEEEFIERCFQEMLEEEEQWEWFIPSRDLPSQTVSQLQEQISLLVLDADVHADADFDVVVNSSLNPNAKEFTPGIQKHVM